MTTKNHEQELLRGEEGVKTPRWYATAPVPIYPPQELIFNAFKQKMIFLDSIESFLDGKQSRTCLRSVGKFIYTGTSVRIYLHSKFNQLYELFGLE